MQWYELTETLELEVSLIEEIEILGFCSSTSVKLDGKK